MVDITSVGTILSSIKTASDIAKLIKDSGTSLEQAEMKLKLADLISALADAKIEVATVQGTLTEKDVEIKELKQKLSVRDAVHYRAPFYWSLTAEGEDGPYCQKCYDVEGRLVRLQKSVNRENVWSCRACRSDFVEGALGYGRNWRVG